MLRVACLTACGIVLLHGAASAASLSVCIDSASATAQRDQSVAEAVARQENLPLAVSHFDGSLDDDGMSAHAFKTLLAKKCDLVMGFPVDVSERSVPSGLFATGSYDQTGFVLVTPADAPATTLAELPSGTAVAVTFEAPPNLYILDHPGLQADIHTTDAETLATVVSGQAKAAMVWQATAANYVASHPGALKLGVTLLAEPHARYDVVALYAQANAEAAARFDKAISALHEAPREADPAIKKIAFTTAGKDAKPAPGKALPALYTEAQATAGESKYAENCVQCHGADLMGSAGPALKGPNFATVKSDFAVSDVFTIVSQNMPASQPGSLPPGDYVEIMAFLLQQNGYPAGSKALTFEDAEASKVPLIYQGK